MKVIRHQKRDSRFKDKVTVNFSIANPMWGRENGRLFVELLKKYSELLYPDKYAAMYATGGNYKNIDLNGDQLIHLWEPSWRKYYDVRSDSKSERIWLDDISFKRSKNPLVRYGIDFNWSKLGEKHCDVHIYFDDAKYFINKLEREHKLWEMLKEMSAFARADFGSVHFATAAQEKAVAYMKADPWEYSSHSSMSLGNYLLNVYLVNIFGPPYIDFFGKERILSSPCYSVQELKCGSIWLQLLPNLPRSQDDFNLLEKRKKEVIEHLNNNAFFDATLQSNHKYNIPKFDLSALQMPIDLPKPKVVARK